MASLVLCLCITSWIASMGLAQNTYTTYNGSNGVSHVWESTSDFVPVQTESYGEIRIGHAMSAEFDFLWNGRSCIPNGCASTENFFRVGFDANNGNNCQGTYSRYPSLWLSSTSDTLYVSISEPDACSAVVTLDGLGEIISGTNYHILISFNMTTVYVSVDNMDTNTPWSTSWARESTDNALVGMYAPIWFMSGKFGRTEYNVANNTRMSNIVIKSDIYTPPPTTAAPSAVPTTAAPTVMPTTGSPTNSPSPAPTLSPSTAPTGTPTTAAPTSVPTTGTPTTAEPTEQPTTPHPTTATTVSPTNEPTSVPTNPTVSPTIEPTLQPTSIPTMTPTTGVPTTAQPTEVPTTGSPSKTPTRTPSSAPTVPTETPTAVPTMEPTTESPTSADSRNEDFWNSNPYTYIFYGAIAFVALLLILMAFCCYCKFKPPADDTEYHFNINGHTTGKKRSLSVPIENIGNHRENVGHEVVHTGSHTHNGDGYSHTPASEEPMMNQISLHRQNVHDRPIAGKLYNRNSVTVSAASDEDVLKGAYGGHITAGGDELFPRDRLRAINDNNAMSPNRGDYIKGHHIEAQQRHSSDYSDEDYYDEEEEEIIDEEEYRGRYNREHHHGQQQHHGGHSHHQTVGPPDEHGSYPYNRHHVDGDEQYIVEMITKDELRRNVEQDMHNLRKHADNNQVGSYASNLYQAQQVEQQRMDDIINEMGTLHGMDEDNESEVMISQNVAPRQVDVEYQSDARKLERKQESMRRLKQRQVVKDKRNVWERGFGYGHDDHHGHQQDDYGDYDI